MAGVSIGHTFLLDALERFEVVLVLSDVLCPCQNGANGFPFRLLIRSTHLVQIRRGNNETSFMRQMFTVPIKTYIHKPSQELVYIGYRSTQSLSAHNNRGLKSFSQTFTALPSIILSISPTNNDNNNTTSDLELQPGIEK